jgi:transposase InsO family protein
MEKARNLRYNQERSLKELANEFGKSERTLYRWLQKGNQQENIDSHIRKPKKVGRKKYTPAIFLRIEELMKEIPQRSAVLVRNQIKKEFPTEIPSLSTIQRFLREKGLTHREIVRRDGYRAFQRSKPNDLWQVDIAGVQTIGHLGKMYLIALLDDCSRFIVAAQYFGDQKGVHLIEIIRKAVLTFGRPNQILADNGTQFRNVIGDLGTKYSKLLESLGVIPIFASPSHPQTKGKLERWFGIVIQMFLVEIRTYVKTHLECTLAEFNQFLDEWVKWYNTEKSHRGLPGKVTPSKIYFEKSDRIFRPLESQINWDQWLYGCIHRKVTKLNQISYKAQNLAVPPGYVGLEVDIMEYETRIEIYYHENLLISHSFQIQILPEKERIFQRKVHGNGNIGYKGHVYTVDYKYAGKIVEIRESNGGHSLLVYFNDLLIKTINLD